MREKIAPSLFVRDEKTAMTITKRKKQESTFIPGERAPLPKSGKRNDPEKRAKRTYRISNIPLSP